MAMGRPTEYTPEKAAEICLLIANGMSMRAVCRHEGMPVLSTVYKWIRQNPDFAKQYARATEDRADAVFEEMFDIADDGINDTYTDDDGVERTNHDVIARSKLRIDTRKWALARMNPRKYGDRVAQEISGPDGGPIETRETSARDIISSKLSRITPRGGEEGDT